MQLNGPRYGTLSIIILACNLLANSNIKFLFQAYIFNFVLPFTLYFLFLFMYVYVYMYVRVFPCKAEKLLILFREYNATKI